MAARHLLIASAAVPPLAYILHDFTTTDSLLIRSSPQYHKFVDQVVTPSIRTVFDGENAHNIAVESSRLGLAPRDYDNRSAFGKEYLQTEEKLLSTSITGNKKRNPQAGGLYLKNCIGLAAGFDKNASSPEALLDMGFGSVEVGSITPLSQVGNLKPRVFRLNEDLGTINRYGFNSDGMNVVYDNIVNFRSVLPIAINGKNEKGSERGALGINLGKNKLQTDAIADYICLIDRFVNLADYLVINVSSPNTPGLRGLQDKEPLRQLLVACLKKIDDAKSTTGDEKKKSPPLLFVKISPDMSKSELADVAEVVLSVGIDGVIISNTTMSRPSSLLSENAKEAGGLSGKPVEALSTLAIKDFYELTNGKVPIIGVGGVSDGKGAYDKIRKGASAIQVYSMLTYGGGGMVRRMKEELIEEIIKGGHKNVSEVVGLDCNRLKLTEKQLSLYNGSDSSKQILISISGKIYDVTESKSFYGLNAPYNVFAGKACTRAIVLGSLEEKDLKMKDKVSDLRNDKVQQQVLFYAKKYNQVGVLAK